jgi:N-acyl-D-aspartate/D-glutamate deacylase
MGERGADPDERPTADELAAMARMVRAGIDGGALGVTTSRTMLHRTRDGAPLGTRHSEADELLALVTPLREAGRGVIQIITDAYLSPDHDFAASELDLLRTLVRSTGRPLSVSVQQPPGLHDRWKEMSAVAEELTAEGYDVKTQMAPRAIGVLEGFTASINPIALCPSYQEVAGLPLAEKVHALGDPERRSRILAEHGALQPEGTLAVLVKAFHNIFPLSDPVDYEPAFEQSIAGIAAASGRPAAEVLYDALLERDGRQLLYVPLFNYLDGNLETVREMLTSPRALFGLSDGGAHCGAICDASFPTTMVGLWGKDRTRGEKLPLELLVHHLTQRTAAHVGWQDRGVLAAGYLADVNVIDLDALAVHPPTIINDLPAGGRRLMQTAEGYRYTIKRGTVTFADGEHTGELPGSLVRGAQRTPA